MATIAYDQKTSAHAIGTPKAAGWVSTVSGLSIVAWWVWTWSRVETMISDHVAVHGQLPVAATERAELSAGGTLAQQQLGADLSAMFGLYPWGAVPLVVGVMLVAVGCSVLASGRRVRIVGALGVSALLLFAPIYVLGDSMSVALDILE